jgi:hypothetical protein
VKAVEEQLSWKTSFVVLVWRTTSTGGCAIFTLARIPIPATAHCVNAAGVFLQYSETKKYRQE